MELAMVPIVPFAFPCSNEELFKQKRQRELQKRNSRARKLC